MVIGMSHIAHHWRDRPQRYLAAFFSLLVLDAVLMPTVAHGQTAGTSEAKSIDDLFRDSVAPPPVAPAERNVMPDAQPLQPKAEKGEPGSINDLFNAGVAPEKGPLTEATPAQSDLAKLPASNVTKASDETRVTGFFQNNLDYTYANPTHWSKFNNMLDIAATGRTERGYAWKLGGRVSYDPIYDLTNYYNSAVRNDQRLEADIREAYIDIPADDWQFRLGRQHIVWGEMAGLFFADVVSAKDMRELTLPDFEIVRIPQWAAQGEYFKGDFHAEGVWIPYMTYNNIGKPGAEFYPYNPQIPGATTVIADEQKPEGLKSAAYGVRLSYINSGWDLTGFAYSSIDASSALARLTPVTAPVVVYQPIHERINQLGATLGKDLGPMVLKAEAVYTMGKLVNVSTLSDADGLIKRDVLDYIVGFEWSFPQETRFNVQLFQTWFPNHDPDMLRNATESGISLLFSTQALNPKLEPKLMLIRSLDRNDWLAQFKLTWRIDGNWRAAFGADVFGGNGLFGQFDNKDRIYSELRYSF
jgi:hypothetical protein